MSKNKNTQIVLKVILITLTLSLLVLFLYFKKAQYDYQTKWRDIIATDSGYKWPDNTRNIRIIENMSDIEEAWDAVLHIQVSANEINSLATSKKINKCNSVTKWDYDVLKTAFKDSFPLPGEADLNCLYSTNLVNESAYLEKFFVSDQNGEIWIVFSHTRINDLPTAISSIPTMTPSTEIYDKNGHIIYKIYDESSRK